MDFNNVKKTILGTGNTVMDKTKKYGSVLIGGAIVGAVVGFFMPGDNKKDQAKLEGEIRSIRLDDAHKIIVSIDDAIIHYTNLYTMGKIGSDRLDENISNAIFELSKGKIGTLDEYNEFCEEFVQKIENMDIE